ncbi:hypothetical protein A6A29_05995 [Streptomyces sp. TSRI0281]|nr:hypothetical protein [Streptomyces sp. TSRI0281]OKI48541.1 hypothetical protein A6A29_05995 [Streptomyces sp. TSRI0281]
MGGVGPADGVLGHGGLAEDDRPGAAEPGTGGRVLSVPPAGVVHGALCGGRALDGGEVVLHGERQSVQWTPGAAAPGVGGVGRERLLREAGHVHTGQRVEPVGVAQGRLDEFPAADGTRAQAVDRLGESGERLLHDAPPDAESGWI